MDPYEHDLLLSGYDSYEAARENFTWDLPDRYNIATDLVETQPRAESQTALEYVTLDGQCERYTYDEIDRRASQVASLLVECGLDREQRVAVSLPDVPQTVWTHMAVFKMGGILVPLSPNYGPEELGYRLRDSDAQYLVTTSDVLDRIAEVSDLATDYTAILTVDSDRRADRRLDECQEFDETFDTVGTEPDDPALMVYTSGTTGDPKGVLHGHRILLGYYPGFEMWNDFELRGDRLFWSNNAWAFTGSLMGHLYSGMHYGGTYLAREMADGHDPDELFQVLDEHGVTNAFLRPEALTDMMESERAYSALDALDVMATGGAPYGRRLVRWIESTLDAVHVEIYGQTEANMLVSECPKWYESRPDRLGRAVPGAEIGVINQYGEEVPDGEIGELSLDESHPAVFKRYWNKPDKTESAFVDGWMLTESMARKDADGYYEFVARRDDIIDLDGRYVSPVEIEAVSTDRPGVVRSAVVSPPESGGASLTMFVELSPDTSVDEASLVDSLSQSLEAALPSHKVPDHIAVVPEIPTTERGKIKRSELV